MVELRPAAAAAALLLAAVASTAHAGEVRETPRVDVAEARFVHRDGIGTVRVTLHAWGGEPEGPFLVNLTERMRGGDGAASERPIDRIPLDGLAPGERRTVTSGPHEPCCRTFRLLVSFDPPPGVAFRCQPGPDRIQCRSGEAFELRLDSAPGLASPGAAALAAAAAAAALLRSRRGPAR